MLEFMCQGRFLSKNPTTGWKFLEDLAKKTMQWETTKDGSLSSKITNARGACIDGDHLRKPLETLPNGPAQAKESKVVKEVHGIVKNRLNNMDSDQVSSSGNWLGFVCSLE